MDVLEDIFFSIFIAALAAGLLVGVAQLFEATDHNTCHERGELANVQVTYRKWKGCYVNQNNLWVPYDNWKYNRDHGFVQK